jgi:hypothetical protein
MAATIASRLKDAAAERKGQDAQAQALEEVSRRKLSATEREVAAAEVVGEPFRHSDGKTYVTKADSKVRTVEPA